MSYERRSPRLYHFSCRFRSKESWKILLKYLFLIPGPLSFTWIENIVFTQWSDKSEFWLIRLMLIRITSSWICFQLIFLFHSSHKMHCYTNWSALCRDPEEIGLIPGKGMVKVSSMWQLNSLSLVLIPCKDKLRNSSTILLTSESCFRKPLPARLCNNIPFHNSIRSFVVCTTLERFWCRVSRISFVRAVQSMINFIDQFKAHIRKVGNEIQRFWISYCYSLRSILPERPFFIVDQLSLSSFKFLIYQSIFDRNGLYTVKRPYHFCMIRFESIFSKTNYGDDSRCHDQKHTSENKVWTAPFAIRCFQWFKNIA